MRDDWEERRVGLLDRSNRCQSFRCRWRIVAADCGVDVCVSLLPAMNAEIWRLRSERLERRLRCVHERLRLCPSRTSLCRARGTRVRSAVHATSSVREEQLEPGRNPPLPATRWTERWSSDIPLDRRATPAVSLTSVLRNREHARVRHCRRQLRSSCRKSRLVFCREDPSVAGSHARSPYSHVCAASRIDAMAIGLALVFGETLARASVVASVRDGSRSADADLPIKQDNPSLVSAPVLSTS